MEEDFHNFRKRLEAQIRILNEVNVSKSNRQNILEYYNYIQARGLSLSRMFRSMITLRQFACKLDKQFSNVTEKEMQAYVALKREEGKKTSTIETNVKILKVFYKWLNGGEYPDCIKNIVCQKDKGKKLLRIKKFFPILSKKINFYHKKHPSPLKFIYIIFF